MNFFDFLDRQFDRLTIEAVAGCGIFMLTVGVLAVTATNPELAESGIWKTLSQAIVVQGLVGLAMAAWFTKRRDDDATGKADDPVNIKGPEE